jgi:hypothetical protein
MTCFAPQEIKEGDLMAFVEERASQQVKEHVARCAFCAAEAAALAQVDRLLQAALYRDACPAPETLLQFQTGLLPAREKRSIERHVQTCPHCTDELARLAALDAPQHGLWEEMRRTARAVVEAVRVAPPSHLAAAVRGGRFSQQLYRAGQLDIVLGSEALPSPHDQWRLRGRVTHAGLAVADLIGHTVRLVQRDRIVAQQTVDDLGYFSFDRLATGRYNLWLEQPETDVVVHGVEVGDWQARES